MDEEKKEGEEVLDPKPDESDALPKEEKKKEVV